MSASTAKIDQVSEPGKGKAEKVKEESPSTESESEDQELANLFKTLSIERCPQARLIIACRHPSWISTSVTDDEDARFELEMFINENWKIMGVLQRVEDCDHLVCLPFHIRCSESPTGFKRVMMELHICYDPTSDKCVIDNGSQEKMPFNFYRVPTEYVTEISHRGVLEPGLWRVSHGSGVYEQHLMMFFIAGRRFVTKIETAKTESEVARIGKHKNTSHEDLPSEFKRLKTVEGMEDFGPSSSSRALQSSQASSPKQEEAASNVVNTACELTHESTNPLLDAGMRQIVSIAEKVKTDGPNNYNVSLLRTVNDGISSKIVTCIHSGLANSQKPVMAKILQPREGEEDLVGEVANCSVLWRSEKEALETLAGHPNITRLQAFDGRLQVLYFDAGPPSLNRIGSYLRREDLLTILMDICSALSYMGSMEYMHNDIKPANITYSSGEGATLIDFGMAATTEFHATGGTVQYFPPEYLLHGERELPSDAWALGVTMLVLLGRIPKHGGPQIESKNDEIRDCESPAHEQMHDWLEQIFNARNGLNKYDKLESCVRLLLKGNAEERATPAKIIAILKGQRLDDEDDAKEEEEDDDKTESESENDHESK